MFRRKRKREQAPRCPECGSSNLVTEEDESITCSNCGAVVRAANTIVLSQDSQNIARVRGNAIQRKQPSKNTSTKISIDSPIDAPVDTSPPNLAKGLYSVLEQQLTLLVSRCRCDLGVVAAGKKIWDAYAAKVGEAGCPPLAMPATLAVAFLAARSVGESIVAWDVLHWARNGVLPYMRGFALLPMPFNSNFDRHRNLFDRVRIPPLASFLRHIRSIASASAEPLAPLRQPGLLLLRYVGRLGFTSRFAVLVLRNALGLLSEPSPLGRLLNGIVQQDAMGAMSLVCVAASMEATPLWERSPPPPPPRLMPLGGRTQPWSRAEAVVLLRPEHNAAALAAAEGLALPPPAALEGYVQFCVEHILAPSRRPELTPGLFAAPHAEFAAIAGSVADAARRRTDSSRASDCADRLLAYVKGGVRKTKSALGGSHAKALPPRGSSHAPRTIILRLSKWDADEDLDAGLRAILRRGAAGLRCTEAILLTRVCAVVACVRKHERAMRLRCLPGSDVLNSLFEAVDGKSAATLRLIDDG